MKNFPSTFDKTKFGNSKIDFSMKSKFSYNGLRSARMVGVYLKGNLKSVIDVTIENDGKVMTPSETFEWLKLPENETKLFSVNALSFVDTCYNSNVFLKF